MAIWSRTTRTDTGRHISRDHGNLIANASRYALALVFSVLLYTSSLAQPDTAWVRRYNGPGNLSDYVTALAVDDSGNVYITGSSRGGTAAEDYATIKYSPAGDTLWVRRYDGPGSAFDYANALAVDASGHAYITGESWGAGSMGDIATIKYSPAGDTLWVRRYNGPANDWDYGNAIAVDSSGNVVVAGYSRGIGTAGDYTIIKYSPTGDTLWTRRYNGPGDDEDDARALHIDRDGNIFVTGSSLGANLWADYATIKYTPAGDTLWVRRYSGTANELDVASALTVDDSGYTYVTGNSRGTGSEEDYATIKYTSTGETVWARRYDGPANDDDGAATVAVDSSGNVYVTGYSRASGTAEDFATIKYSPAGDTLWVRRFNGSANGPDGAHALTVDAIGNVYVAGGIEELATGQDYLTIKYAPTGDTLWTLRYDGPGSNVAADWWDIDGANALALDRSGNICIAGSSGGSGTDADYATIKYLGCLVARTGDVNLDGEITAADVIYTVNYLFKAGNDPLPCAASGDVDCDGIPTAADLIYLVNHAFKAGPAPCDVCTLIPGVWPCP